MSEIITINDSEFNLGTAEGCEQAKEHVTAHITALEQKKGELTAKLEASFLDFRKSKALRAELQETKEELLHSGRLLQSLDEKYAGVSKEEEIAAAQKEIARMEKQTAALAAVCEKEIPAASRKLAVIAAALQRNLNERESMVDRAENAGLDTPEMRDPLQRIAGKRAFVRSWLKYLYLPLLDEDPDMASFWPLPNMVQYPDTHQDNPKIRDDVEELLSSDDMTKAAKALFAKIEKRKTVIREAEQGPYSFQDHSEPMWYERPRGEWAELLAPNPVMTCVNQLGNKIQFWLELPQARKFGAFLYLLDPEERERALKQIPEDERQQYLDLLMQHACNDDFEDGLEQAESAA